MSTKLAFLLPIAIILASAIFVLYSSKGTPISRQFSVNLLTPTPYKQLPSGQSTATPVNNNPTPTTNSKNTLPLSKIYTPTQIQYFKTHQIYDYIKDTKFPPLPQITSIDKQIPVYMFNCIDSLNGFSFTPIIDYVPRNNKPIFETINLMATKAYASYPTQDEISRYQKNSQITFKHQIGGVNSVNLDTNGILFVDYFDSVQGYGGGSTRLQCMGIGSLLTAMQYSQVKGIKQCIDETPTSLDSCPYDFQP